MHFLDRERDMRRGGARTQFGAGAEQAVDAFRQHHDIGMDGSASRSVRTPITLP